MLLEVENLAYSLYNAHKKMRLYPKGLYSPYELNPIADLTRSTDINGKPIDINQLEIYDVIINEDGEIVYDRENKHFSKVALKPYIPYRPYKVIMEYIERFLDNLIEDQELGKRCPIIGNVPIIHDGFKSINDICRDNYDIRLPKKFSRLSSLNRQLQEVSDYYSTDTIFEVSTVGKYINIERKGTIKEIRYELLLQEERVRMEVDRDNRIIAKDWQKF